MTFLNHVKEKYRQEIIKDVEKNMKYLTRKCLYISVKTFKTSAEWSGCIKRTNSWWLDNLNNIIYPFLVYGVSSFYEKKNLENFSSNLINIFMFHKIRCFSRLPLDSLAETPEL